MAHINELYKKGSQKLPAHTRFVKYAEKSQKKQGRKKGKGSFYLTF